MKKLGCILSLALALLTLAGCATMRAGVCALFEVALVRAEAAVEKWDRIYKATGDQDALERLLRAQAARLAARLAVDRCRGRQDGDDMLPDRSRVVMVSTSPDDGTIRYRRILPGPQLEATTVLDLAEELAALEREGP